jgi:hypothetical protein
MTAALKIMQIVNWNLMPDFYVCGMKMNMFQIELYGPMKFFLGVGVSLSPLGMLAANWFIVPALGYR